MWILRVFLKAGHTVEMIYLREDNCRRDIKTLGGVGALAIRDDYGKALTIDAADIAAVQSSDYAAELNGMEAIRKAQMGVQEILQRHAAARAGLIGGAPQMGGNGRVVING